MTSDAVSTPPPDRKKTIKKTVRLPQTKFDMQANLERLEPALWKRWEEADLYGEVRKTRRGSPRYILHDGPPYASGELHVGTGMNKILKDVVVKYKTMRGFDAPFVPGWDCHGLPIEHKVLQDMRDKKADWSLAVIRTRSEEFARKHIEGHRRQFKALGILGRWEDPYLTLNPRYEAGVIEVFEKLVEKGYIARHRKPIHWCPKDRTALAEAELEYIERKDPSIYCRFPADLSSVFGDAGKNAGLIVWTTTPWTLFGNVAVAVHPDHTYALCHYTRAGVTEASLLADPLREKVLAHVGASNVSVLGTTRGSALIGCKYERPFAHVCVEGQDGRFGPIVVAGYVSMDDGSGLVHTAPGHGQEDYATGMKESLPVLSPVDAGGCFIDPVPAPYCGSMVLDANAGIIDDLRARGVLLKATEFSHSYPHCWRCKGPLIFRATPQWFVQVDHDHLRERALQAIAATTWVPSWGQIRIESMVKERPDWCISRQRAWGIPIPAFYCEGCAEPLLTVASVRRIKEVFAAKGANAWFIEDAPSLLGDGFTCAKCGGTRFRKENDIFDVWFESGSSWNAVVNQEPELSYPADLYLEGSDQHRGWFQLSLLPALGATGQAPFKTVVTHGFVVDEKGEKMSKSLGNYISLADALKKYSGDILRLYFTSVDYGNDVRVSTQLIDRMRETYRKIRNTFRFLLGNLSDFAGGGDESAMELVDRFVLVELERMRSQVEEAYESFRFHRVFRLIHDFCVVTLSNTTFEIVRDRLYCDALDAPRRRATQHVLYETLKVLTRLVAPILVHTADEVWDHVRAIATRCGETLASSVHLAPWPTPLAFAGNADDVAKRWEVVAKVREDTLRAVEKQRKDGAVGSGTDALVQLGTAEPALKATLQAIGRNELAELLVVGQVDWLDGNQGEAGESLPALRLTASASPHGKCERCWVLREDVKGGLCARCTGVLASMGVLL